MQLHFLQGILAVFLSLLPTPHTPESARNASFVFGPTYCQELAIYRSPADFYVEWVAAVHRQLKAAEVSMADFLLLWFAINSFRSLSSGAVAKRWRIIALPFVPRACKALYAVLLDSVPELYRALCDLPLPDSIALVLVISTFVVPRYFKVSFSGVTILKYIDLSLSSVKPNATSPPLSPLHLPQS